LLPHGRKENVRIPPHVKPAVVFFGLYRSQFKNLDQAIQTLQRTYPVLAEPSSTAKVSNLRKHHYDYYDQYRRLNSHCRASIVATEKNAAASASSSSAGAHLNGAVFRRAVNAKAAEFRQRDQLVSDAQCGFHAYVFV
jgi:hypothetical protein